MPLFSVTLMEQNCPNPQWARTTLKVRAVSAKHAMKKAEAKLDTSHLVLKGPEFLATSARRYAVDHNYWRKVWKKAYDNMPTRIYVQKHEQWHVQEPNSTTMPEFIKGSAHGTMQRGQDGEVLKLVIVRKAYKMGAEAALTRLLNYSKWSKQHSLAHKAVANAMMRGSRPETEERRTLLLLLAGRNGTSIAAEMLGRQFQPIKIKGGK